LNTNIQTLMTNAITLLDSGNLHEAKQAFEYISSLDSGNAEAWLMRAAIEGELGEIESAISCCQSTIRLEPENAQAYVIFGRLLIATGDMENAVAQLQAAVTVDPEFGEAWSLLASLYGKRGNYQEAEKAARTAIRLLPDSVDAYISLANALFAQGEHQQAIEISGKATRLDPSRIEAPLIMASALETSGEPEHAEAIYRRITGLDHSCVDALTGIGRILKDKGDLQGAGDALQKALQIEPGCPNAHLVMGQINETLKTTHLAVQHYQEALNSDPACVGAWTGLGNIMQANGHFDQAAENYERALQLEPNNADVHYNSGVMYNRQGNQDQALDCLDRAIELRPDFVEAHWNKSFIYLLSGDYTRGWPEYEWRLRKKAHINRPFNKPAWDGSSLAGRTILVHDEQGYGDTLQFIRYLSLLKSAERVIFECHPGLSPLLQGFEDYDQLIERKSAHEVPDIPFDTHVYLMSLPYLTGTTSQTAIPGLTPYLRADRELSEKWEEKLSGDPGFKIGICWKGGPQHTNEAYRSCPLEAFAPLAEVPGVSLYSLQKEVSRHAIEALPGGYQLKTPGENIDTKGRFTDTAAIMSNLDLVVSIDTAILHLAGALGCPTWALLCASPDWRWSRQGTGTPWYPKMRLFRQPRLGDWNSVLGQVAKSLRQHVSENEENRHISDN